ncbi:hypothetical protein ACFC1T_36520 [Kitasatospora sp. NPDC056076]|uniref:hypothetical protein n=1 Tax=Kitasatospora sp. NPDC056076 TaxID=3345703 RepID=UPI0035E20411
MTTATEGKTSMPKIPEEYGGHLPHHDYIAQVVTALEAIGRGPDGWRLEEADPATGAPALQAALGWGAGNHNPHGGPDASDADLLLTVNWDAAGGWSYIWEQGPGPADSFPPMDLDVPAVSDPADLAQSLRYVMDGETGGRMPHPARWDDAERMREAVRAWQAGR